MTTEPPRRIDVLDGPLQAVVADLPGSKSIANRALVCAVFAPTQVAALDAVVGIPRIDAVFAAIGNTTTEALRAAGAHRIVTAAEPTPEGLANAVSTVYPTLR